MAIMGHTTGAALDGKNASPVWVKSCGVVVQALSGAVYYYIGQYSRSRPELVAILGGKLISGFIISHDVCGRYGI